MSNIMRRRMIIMLAATGVVLGGVIAFISFGHYMRDKFMHSMSQPPQTVSAVLATSQLWQPKLSAIGSFRALNGADLSAAVAGLVSAIHFESGAHVKAGTLLVELAQADDVAKLNSLKATAALARITLQRDLQQLKFQGVSRETVDVDEQTLKSDLAQVAQQQAIVNYKNIRAPFDGVLGIRQVDIGQYVSPGTIIVTLQSFDAIYVDFYLPQQATAAIRTGLPITATVDTYPGKVFSGSIIAINPKIDTGTRNVLIRAQLENSGHLLLPGTYGSIQIAAGAPTRHVTLPTSAISYSPYGATVFLIEDGGKGTDGRRNYVTRQVEITTGMTRGDQVAVLSGIKPGDKVVTAGQIKLHNGTLVVIDNTVTPTFGSALPTTNQ